ncbi:MAG: secondary thiamine-phosphate synthase enzyme YjbQ [Candidatus Diapherotrites archaeon]
MKVYSDSIKLHTKKELELTNISDQLEKILSNSKLKKGIACLFAVGSTCALTTIEFESGLLKDFPSFLERIIPKKGHYEHQLAWEDGNGHSHVRSSLLKTDLVIPFNEGRLATGTWQQITFIELDVRPRNREVIVQILGE